MASVSDWIGGFDPIRSTYLAPFSLQARCKGYLPKLSPFFLVREVVNLDRLSHDRLILADSVWLWLCSWVSLISLSLRHSKGRSASSFSSLLQSSVWFWTQLAFDICVNKFPDSDLSNLKVVSWPTLFRSNTGAKRQIETDTVNSLTPTVR